MEEIGKVVRLAGENATVLFQRKPACGKCGMCMGSPKDAFVQMTLKNGLNAKEGDNVRVSTNSGDVLKSILIIYLIPLILGIIGLVAGYYLLGEIAGFVGMLLFVAAGYFVVNRIDKRLNKTTKLVPKIIAIEQNYMPEAGAAGDGE
jgi:positive regulator of sigma E activity